MAEEQITFNTVLEAELLEIDRRRSAWGQDRTEHPADAVHRLKLVGLACSGGGMRAAAFAIGAFQALSDSEWRSGLSFLDRVDYISSVSGGSWAACSLASAAAQPTREKLFSSQDHNHISHIARNARLLNSRGWKDYFEIAGLWLYSFVTGLIIIFPFILICASIFLWQFPDVTSIENYNKTQEWYFGWLLGISCLVYAVFALTYSVERLRWFAVFLGRVWPQSLLAIIGLMFILIQPKMVLNSLPAHGIYQELVSSRFRFMLGIHEVVAVGVALAISVFFLIVLLFRQEQFGRKDTRSLSSVLRRFGIAALFIVNAVLVPLFLWGIVLMLARWGVDGITRFCPPDIKSCGLSDHHFAPAWIVRAAEFVDCWSSEWLGRLCAGKSWATSCELKDPCANAFIVIYVSVAAILYVFGKFILDTNWTSLHRFYRDRLYNSFIFPKHDVTSVFRISDSTHDAVPYLIVNCTANTNTSDLLNESFIISPQFVGSTDVGYSKTADFEYASGKYFDIATVAAISGAAISPVMGRYTNKSIRLLMAILAFRLGYWIPNPRYIALQQNRRDSNLPPGRRVGSFYYLREMLGWMTVKSNFIYLTDGGHTDNSGIFELLRRRCSTIIAIDAEADPELLFENISYVMQLAKVRLNTEILLSAQQVARERGVHCAVADIKYPALSKEKPAFLGKLIYCKSSVIGDENWDLICRKKATGEFPYNSTLNQNYDELLFDAYRALGCRIVRGLLVEQDRTEFVDHQFRGLLPADVENLFGDR